MDSDSVRKSNNRILLGGNWFAVTLLVQAHVPYRCKRPRTEFALIRFLVRVNPPDVCVHVVLLAERFLTVLAYVRFLARMHPEMLLVRPGGGEPLGADVALVALLTCMCSDVHVVGRGRGGNFTTVRTNASLPPIPRLPFPFLLLGQVGGFMQSQMGRSLETLLANIADEIPGIDVHRIMVAQFTFLGKSFAAFIAHEGQIFRVDIFDVCPKSTLRGVPFVAFRTFKCSDSAVLNFVVHKT